MSTGNRGWPLSGGGRVRGAGQAEQEEPQHVPRPWGRRRRGREEPVEASKAMKWAAEDTGRRSGGPMA